MDQAGKGARKPRGRAGAEPPDRAPAAREGWGRLNVSHRVGQREAFSTFRASIKVCCISHTQ